VQQAEAGVRRRQPVDAANVLFGRYYQRVLGYLTVRLSDGERARDLAQDTFRDAWRDLGQLRDPDRFAGWLYRIARNTLNAELRRQHRAPPLVPLERALNLPGVPAPGLARLLVTQALERLPTDMDRQLLVMDGVWGMSAREIATALGIPRPTAYARLERAKRRFRERYPVE